jgi:hypothetical protein
MKLKRSLVWIACLSVYGISNAAENNINAPMVKVPASNAYNDLLIGETIEGDKLNGRR